MFEGEGNKEKPFIPPKEDDIERSQSGYNNFGIDDKEESIKLKNIYGKGIKGEQIRNMSNQEKESSFTEKPEGKEHSFEEKINDFTSSEGKEGKPLLKQNSPLFRIAKSASLPSNQNLEDLKNIKKLGEELYIKGETKENEWELLGGVIQEKIEELEKASKGEEPEIERLRRPESAPEAIGMFFGEIFELHERGLREGKKWEEAGGLFSEYTTIQRWVKDLPLNIKGEEIKDKQLTNILRKEFPKGIFLKEKMELFLEAMKRLHNRQVEVIKSEGGLEDLGVPVSGESAVPVLKVPLTNIRPRDWHLLTHVDGIFTESMSPENKINIQMAWDKWQEVGKYPYALYEYKIKKGENLREEITDQNLKELWRLVKEDVILKEIAKLIDRDDQNKIDNFRRKVSEDFDNFGHKGLESSEAKEIIGMLFNNKFLVKVTHEINDKKNEISSKRNESDFEKKLRLGVYEWGQVRWDLEKFKKIKEFQSKREFNDAFKIENFVSSESAMSILRESMVESLRHDGINETAAVRSESLAHALLTVDLAFYVWDRERWKDSGKMDARDLMWLDWKRIKRFTAEDLRPAGPWDTVGCFFADELLMGKKNKNVVVENYLKENRERALFLVKPTTPSIGTIVGDFFNSKTYFPVEIDKNGNIVKRELNVKRLADAESLKDIPWLDPMQFEEETYKGHFTYNLMFASAMEENIKKLDWDPNKGLKGKDLWVKLTDLTLRLGHFCPTLVNVPREKRETVNQIIYRFRRILARGIFWTGSFQAQPNPESFFASGSFSKDDVYGKKLLTFFKDQPGILDAIKSSGYLDEKNSQKLEKEIYDFNFHLKGGSSQGRH